MRHVWVSMGRGCLCTLAYTKFPSDVNESGRRFIGQSKEGCVYLLGCSTAAALFTLTLNQLQENPGIRDASVRSYSN